MNTQSIFDTLWVDLGCTHRVAQAEKAALLQRQRVGGKERSDLSSLDHSVAGKVIDTFTGPAALVTKENHPKAG